VDTQTIVILDFGSQYTQLIARRIRELNVFSVVLPCTAPLNEIQAYKPLGIVLSGGPSSVYDADAPDADAKVLELGVPVLHPSDKDPSAGTPLTQIDEVRSCNGYYSASDLRIHFGLGEAKKVDLVEIRWPSGTVDTLKDLDVNRLYVIEEGGKILKNEPLTAARKKA